MKCNKCGAFVPDNNKFCLECGAPQNIDENAAMNPPNPSNAPVNPDYGTSSSPTITIGSKKISVKLIGKLAVLLALICFFLPFMSISCAGTKTNISGTDMIFGDSDVTAEADSRSSDHSHLFNLFVCLSAVAGIAAIVVPKAKMSSALSAGAGGLLILFRMTAKIYYKIDKASLRELEKTYSSFEVSFSFWLYLAIILFLAAAVAIIISEQKSKSSSPPV